MLNETSQVVERAWENWRAAGKAAEEAWETYFETCKAYWSLIQASQQ